MSVKKLLFVFALICCPVALTVGCGDSGNTVVEGTPENDVAPEDYDEQSYADTSDEDQN